MGFVRIDYCDTAFIAKQMLCLLGLLFIVVYYHVHLYVILTVDKQVKTLKIYIPLHNGKNFNSYFTENLVCVHYKAQPANVVWKNSRTLVCVIQKTSIYSVCKCRILCSRRSNVYLPRFNWIDVVFDIVVVCLYVCLLLPLRMDIHNNNEINLIKLLVDTLSPHHSAVLRLRLEETPYSNGLSWRYNVK